MQLSEKMKDVLKQLCIFEKQLAKHTKKCLGIFLYTTKMIFGIRLNHAIYVHINFTLFKQITYVFLHIFSFVIV